MGKDLSKLTTEQLMDLAKNPIQEKRKTRFSPVKEFILSEKIVAGDYPIPGVVIYDRYTTWARANSLDILTQHKFFMELKHHFVKKTKADGKHYMISPTGFDLSPQHHSQLKEEHRKRISNGQENKAKKKKIKKSSQKVNNF